jgi:hypothetical protein
MASKLLKQKMMKELPTQQRVFNEEKSYAEASSLARRSSTFYRVHFDSAVALLEVLNIITGTPGPRRATGTALH